MPGRTITLRRRDICVRCGSELRAGAVASWDRASRTVTCAPCVADCDGAAAVAANPASVEPRPGASLGRTAERRRLHREQRVREAHPRIGGLLLALTDEPQPEKAFRQGERGEILVGEAIDRVAEKVGGCALHNRRVPGLTGDVDHIAVVPSGIYVVDAKAVAGRVEARSRWFKPPLLYVGRRDRTRYLDGMDRQTEAVRQALSSGGDLASAVHGALCFTKATLPRLRTLEMRGHLLLDRKSLTRRLSEPGPLTAETCVEVAAGLSVALRAA